MTITEAADLLVEAIRHLSHARAERNAWRLIAQHALKYAATNARAVARIREARQRLREQRRARQRRQQDAT